MVPIVCGSTASLGREDVTPARLPKPALLRHNILRHPNIESSPMPLSMYQASVPAFLRALGSLSAILDKAEAFAASRKIDPEVLLNWRLAPDMFPFVRQVQIAADFAKGTTARLAGAEVPKFDDNEKTFAELKARIAKTVKFVEGFKPEAIDGSEGRDITLTVGGQELRFKGEPYLVHFSLPNFYFHATTAYAILRRCGVEIGKRDFMGMV
jgi:hypothetical protein